MNKITYKDLSLNIETRRAKRGKNEVQLTNTEHFLLKYMMDNPGIVLTGKMISVGAWKEEWQPFSNKLAVYIKLLRRKVDEGFPVKLIHTVRGEGYRFGVI